MELRAEEPQTCQEEMQQVARQWHPVDQVVIQLLEERIWQETRTVTIAGPRITGHMIAQNSATSRKRSCT